jgi:5-formyltetrahydrofolate cyclo-ligase
LNPADKDTLRRMARAARMETPVEDRRRMAQKLSDNFISNVVLPPAAIVAGYHPVRAEMDVMPLLSALLARGQTIALPVIEERNKPLLFRTWDENTRLKEGHFTIPEPDAAFSRVVMPDVLIVPMLAFDADGNRLGYGAGHYDRTLAVMKKKPLLIGVAYAFSQAEAVPADPHDIKMDIIVTDSGFYRFGAHRKESA